MIEPNENGSISLGYGRATLTARGFTVIVILCAVIIAGATFLMGNRMETTTARGFGELVDLMKAEHKRDSFFEERQSVEHRQLGDDMRVVACIQSMSAELRNQVRQMPFVQWDLLCPGIIRRTPPGLPDPRRDDIPVPR